MPRSLTRHDYRTLALAALGGALEFYDFVIYVFLAPVIGRLFFPADMPDWLRLLLTFGILMGSVMAGAINSFYGPADVAAFAWRLPFIAGGVFGFVSVYLRRFL